MSLQGRHAETGDTTLFCQHNENSQTLVDLSFCHQTPALSPYTRPFNLTVMFTSVPPIPRALRTESLVKYLLSNENVFIECFCDAEFYKLAKHRK